MMSRLKFTLLLGATALPLAFAGASLPACTSTQTVLIVSGEGGSEGGPVIDPEEAGPADAQPPKPDAPAAPATNPYGVPYPTQNIGKTVRNGTVRGSVIANLKFVGYVPAATTTSPVQLADVFDPQGRTHDIVALLLVANWAPPCRNLMQQLQAGMPTRVAVMSVLGEGAAPGAAATLSDLSTWRTQTALPAAWAVLDPSFVQFPAPLYDHTAVPAIIILDARTMEIVSSELGAPPQPKAALETFRDDVKARPPAY